MFRGPNHNKKNDEELKMGKFFELIQLELNKKSTK